MNSALQRECDRFRSWAVGREGSYGEWECDYHDWQSLWKAVDDAIERSPVSPFEEMDFLNLLYVLGRDNEIEWIRKRLIHFPDLLHQLALRAVDHPDDAIGWQIAVSISEANLPDAAILLTPYLTDSNEYVRRRSLLALASVDPTRAEEIAISNLADDYAYTRMAALYVLAEVGSLRVHAEATRMLDDPDEYVRETAVKILQSQKQVNPR